METIGELRVRRHSSAGPSVIVLHGGPGAAGSAVELARGLSDGFSVIEPWQRGSERDRVLTVARHVADLHDVVMFVHADRNPALVGESWGAMLALVYAAEYPHHAGPIVLVGCGTFDEHSRARAIEIREKRIAEHIGRHPEHAGDLKLSPEERIMKWHEITDRYEAVSSSPEMPDEPFDMKGYTETWGDMLRCQEAGLYPAAFSRIESPVIMLHGSYDPHPGKMIRDNLKQYIPQLEYLEFDRCGHQPAIEKFARDEFFASMRKWLAANCSR